MFDFFDALDSPTARMALWCAALAALLAVGLYLIGLFRGNLRNQDAGEQNLLTNFRELHGQGELDDEEYRTIKAMLSSRIQQGIKDSGQEG